MNIINDVLLNPYILSFLVAWIISILIKAYMKSRQHGNRFDIFSGIENGGMPSSHSTVVSAITVAILLREGFSSVFVLAFIFSMIIIADSFGLRQNVGIQGDALNGLLEKSKEKTIKVVYGHTFFQVIVGIVLGALVSIILFFLL